jgi:GntR family transcriptional regulator
MTTMSGTPAYVQVAEDLRSKIADGELPPGAQLPSNAQLREIYSVSNTVIRDAMNQLRRDGLVIGQQGKGVFVRSTSAEPSTPDRALDRLAEDFTAAVAVIESQPDGRQAFQAAAHLLASLRTAIRDARQLRASLALRITEDEKLSLAGLADRFSMSRGHAQQLTEDAKAVCVEGEESR